MKLWSGIMLKNKVLKSVDDLKQHIKLNIPSFYFSSQTSTVIPYDRIAQYLPQDSEYYLCDLSKMPTHYELNENNNLVVRGALSWKDAKAFLKSKGRNIMTSPTEELALVMAGAATSCTGERCFGLGNMRSQIKRIKYVDFQAQECELFCHKKLELGSELLKYQQEFKQYENFKNAPFPRFEYETDLMIGTEGQLGVITEIEIETVEDFDVNYFFVLLPKWEESLDAHMELFHKVQYFRKQIVSVELIDHKSFAYLSTEDRLGDDQDVVFLEIKSSAFEEVFEKLFGELEHIGENDIFEISQARFHQVRATVPRAIFEENSKQGVVKMGTDVQVQSSDFKELLLYYREMASKGIQYNLFGHFGDAHLHFNFMPKKENLNECIPHLEALYAKVLKWKGSPFAEHGIGILKQKYIAPFLGPAQKELFKQLKTKHDPQNIFFPQGFMTKNAK